MYYMKWNTNSFLEKFSSAYYNCFVLLNHLVKNSVVDEISKEFDE